MERVVEGESAPTPFVEEGVPTSCVVLCDNVHKMHQAMLDSLATFGNKQLWYASLTCLLLSVVGLVCYECAHLDQSLGPDVSTKMILTASGLISVAASARFRFCPNDIKVDLGYAIKALPWVMCAIVAWSRGVYDTYLTGHSYLAAAFFLESCVWSQCLSMGLCGCVSMFFVYHQRKVAYFGSGVSLGYPEGCWSQVLKDYLSLSERLTTWRVCSLKVVDGPMLLLQDTLAARTIFEAAVKEDYANAIGQRASFDHGAGCIGPQNTLSESVASSDFSNFFRVATEYGVDVQRCKRMDACFSQIQGLLDQDEFERRVTDFVDAFGWTRDQVLLELDQRNEVAIESMIK